MRAITIAPATAACVLHHGQDILNRTYEFPRQLINKEIFLHTSNGFPHDAIDIYRSYGIEVEPLQPGCLVAKVRICDRPIVTNSAWAKPGFYYWRIEVLAILPRPLPYQGGAGIWSLDKDIHKYIYQQIGKGKAPKILATVP